MCKINEIIIKRHLKRHLNNWNYMLLLGGLNKYNFYIAWLHSSPETIHTTTISHQH